ncbi:Stk1 family PASTA domain-containing Ser/Thr kinase [Holzapfeliella floricola]|uniref:non-specific serine/threonine protein kinase n=1 Tax=Holzapfeliella floricola DSM 23037 = JCM 16512 TaxID=1423744 RepID=A0A0R2DIC3_9LACO|nr:Stk1 family PASTA domain-containing Ser/Thr kinase [Holzapfeliella floricola]KRN03840.1 non-specific serine threonine protein kinase [Holzapfeliella floricola DSM 23037 = JCM 16512]
MLEKGYLLAKRYKIIKLIGRGGMADVYLAQDIILERHVAIKVMRGEFQNNSPLVRRFQREALATSELSHPNIVSILDISESQGMQYLVMEYIDGSNLKDYIKENYPISMNKVINIMDQILSAIKLAHQHEVIHRDLKSQNILISKTGVVKVADFGIAISLGKNAVTQTNSLLGSVHYISPEQAKGSMATKQSDIYSLGIILYELITGNVPFGGETAVSIALKHFQENIPSIRKMHPDIPQSLENVVLKATSKDPEDRYESVSKMKADLDSALAANRVDEVKYEPAHALKTDDTKVIPDLSGHVANLTEAEREETNHGAESSEEDKVPKKRHLFWFIGSGITLFLLIIFLVFKVFASNGTMIMVPNLENLTQSEAQSQLTAQGLAVGAVDGQNNSTVEKDKIIRSMPSANTQVRSGTKIGLIISSGPGLTAIPNVVNQNYDQAKEVLEKAGFTVQRKDQSSDSVDKDLILAQSEPSGKQVDASKTTITLTVSTGIQKIKLRDLSGYSEKSARDYANEVGINLTIKQDYSNNTPEGQIISQNPNAQVEVKKDDNVTVTISKGKEPSYESSSSSSSSSQSNNNKIITQSFEIDYKKDTAVNGQNHIQIYVSDALNSGRNIYRDEQITQDKDYTITFNLAPNTNGSVRIVRDGETIINQTVKN